MLRATTAYTFSTCQLPRVLRTWCALYVLTSKCASRHNGVHFFDIATFKSALKLKCLYILTSKCAACHNGVRFFISHLARLLRTRRFSDLLFDPPEPQIIGKTQCFATFLPFSHLDLLSSDCLFFDPLSSSLLFSYSSHLCFSSVHIVGSLTSKLPSTS